MPRPWLLYHSLLYFMSELRDESGKPLRIDPHHEEWVGLLQSYPLLCLLAPRDHGKSWSLIAYFLWCLWRHNRDPDTGILYEDRREGPWQGVIFSNTLAQAQILFEALQGLLLANVDLFADLIPDFRQARSRQRDVWSNRRIGLRNGARLFIRGWRTSTRGLHPDVVALDDVLDDQNTLTSYQRDKSWTYFAGTLVPMNAKKYIVVGTAFHYDDLLHRLRPKKKKPGQTAITAGLMINKRPAEFHWVKYRAVNWKTGRVLWEWRHNLADLEVLRGLLSLLFSREYQNDPVDDSTSLFPFTLTGKATEAGKNLTFVSKWERSQAGEWIIAGHDLAISAEAGADYTVLWVGTWNRYSGIRRLLWATRQHGLDITGQLELLRTAKRAYNFDLCIVEENNFQKWLLAEVKKDGLLNGSVLGHRTGQEKSDFEDGVPALRISMENGLWVVPTGDEESNLFAQIWQSEMAAYGWKDGKLQGVGEHDDCVMATWFFERAVRTIEEWIRHSEEQEGDLVTGEDLGIEPVRIGDPYQ